MTTLERPVCDVCGEPATTFARDQIIQPHSGEIEIFKLGNLKAGCDLHPVESKIVKDWEFRAL